MWLVASARKDKVSLNRRAVLTVQSKVGTEGEKAGAAFLEDYAGGGHRLFMANVKWTF